MASIKADTTRSSALWSFFWRFALVGASGVGVNQGMLYLWHYILKLPVAVSGALAIETAILNNFTWNNLWTWRHRRHAPLWKRLTRYHLTSALAGSINYITLLVLTALGMQPIWANFIGIGLGVVLNFLGNHYWTFARMPEQSNPNPYKKE